MNLRAAKVSLVLTTLLCLGSLCTPSVEAGVIPAVYDFIFGPVGSVRARHTTAYGPAYADGGCCGESAPSYGTWNTGYGLFGWRRRRCCGYQASSGLDWGNAYASCGSCGTSPCGSSPCGASGCGPSGCAGGQCGLAPDAGSSVLNPIPDAPPRGKSTFAPGSEQTPAPERNESEEFTPRERGGGSYGPNVTPPAPEATSPPSAIQKREAAPTDAAPAPESEKTGNIQGPSLVPLQLDGKVAWRPEVKMERMTITSNHANVRVSRRPLYAKATWTPGLPTEVIAKK